MITGKSEGFTETNKGNKLDGGLGTPDKQANHDEASATLQNPSEDRSTHENKEIDSPGCWSRIKMSWRNEGNLAGKIQVL